MTQMLTSIDPADGAVVGEVPVASEAAVAEAVARARAAQPAWHGLGLSRRREILAAIRPVLEESLERLGSLIHREMGKPEREAHGEARACVKGWDALLDEIVDALEPEVLEDERTRTIQLRDPYGVAAVISPWNFPVLMPYQMVVPALLAGNTVVMKPSEETPLVAQAWADVLIGGLPDHVLQVVHGDEVQGKALVASDVDLVAFTGSRGAGAHILQASGAGIKRVMLELGGKDPLVVLDDADVASAARFAARSSLRNAGQVCVSTERIYVHDDVADAFEAEVIRLVPEVTIGPMVHERQKAHVLSQIADAEAAGATVAVRGAGEGNWLGPTVLLGVTHDMAIMREETFGPVVSVMRVSSEDEAIERANDTPYGLGAVVFSGDEARGLRVAARIQAGMVGVNRGVGGASGAPWVGMKQSGLGHHSGREGHRQFAQLRIISHTLS